jgi:hypothetical protein
MTTLYLTGLVHPHVVEMTKREDNPNAAEFRLQPLERGYGYTLGNSLRRLLLSSLRGAAVWAFRLDGVMHEHQTIPGVVEDVHQIIQRLKQLTLVLAPDVDEAVLRFKVEKAGPVYAAIRAAWLGVDRQSRAAAVHGADDRDIAGELYVNKGRGYVEAEQHPVDRTLAVDNTRRFDLQSGAARHPHRGGNARLSAHGRPAYAERRRTAHFARGRCRLRAARAGALPLLRRLRQVPTTGRADGRMVPKAAASVLNRAIDDAGRLFAR